MPKASKNGGPAFTACEQEVLKLIAEGYGNQDIADDLKISVEKVKQSVSSLMTKLNCSDIHSVLDYALRKRLITVYEILESRFLKLALKRKIQPQGSSDRLGA